MESLEQRLSVTQEQVTEHIPRRLCWTEAELAEAVEIGISYVDSGMNNIEEFMARWPKEKK